MIQEAGMEKFHRTCALPGAWSRIGGVTDQDREANEAAQKQHPSMLQKYHGESGEYIAETEVAKTLRA